MTACNYLYMVERDDALDEATRVLYAAPPEHFTAKRAELARAAKQAGHPATAQAVTRLRKPTVAAWIVNAYVAANPQLGEKLTGIGDELRSAQDSLQVDQLRSLSADRRELVRTLARQALQHAERLDAPPALHEEVLATFDAAVADPTIAMSLGSLQHAERFSGFGFGAAPQLTVVRGGQRNGSGQEEGNGATGRGRTAAEPGSAARRRAAQAVETARAAVGDADAVLEKARADERTARLRGQDVERQIAELRTQLDAAQVAADEARAATAAARAARKVAVAQLQRAERAAD